MVLNDSTPTLPISVQPGETLALLTLDGSGRVLSFNQAACGLFGCSPPALRQLTFDELFGPWEPPRPDTWVAFADLEKRGEKPLLLAARRRDKTVIATRVLLSSAQGDEQPPYLCVVQPREVDPQPGGPGREQHRETYYQRLFAQTPIGHLTLDRHGVIKGINPALLAHFQEIGAEKILHESDVLHSPQAEEIGIDDVLRHAIRTGEPAMREVEVHTTDNRILPFLIRVTPLRDRKGHVDGFVCTYEDNRLGREIQQELIEAREQALQSARLKSEFLAKMSHELRTPLNGIIGFIKLIEDEAYTDEEQRKDFLASARQAAMTLLDLINNVLDLARIEAGKLSFVQTDFDVATLVEEVTSTLAPQAHAKGLEIASCVDPSVPNQLRGDPIRLRQVLYNLAGNAVKFTMSGAVLLRASLEPGSGSEYAIRFAVTDTGVGISPEYQAKVFTSFFQPHDKLSLHMGGAGLGLPISKQIVEHMGGDIGLESQPGGGSTFWFRVTLAPPESADPREGEKTPLPSGKRTLLVDPNPHTRDLYAQKLEAMNIEVRAVERTAQALAALNEGWVMGQPFQMVLVDQQIGQEAATRFAQTVRWEVDLPQPDLIYLANLGAVTHVNTLREAGYSGFVTKPLSVHTLHAAFAGTISDRANSNSVSRDESDPGGPQAADASRPSPLAVRVLVAEDNPVIQKLINALLTKQGYEVTLAANGREAVNALSNGPYDLVLMDVQMPLMDGLTATREIRKRLKNRPLPIIAMTADTLEGDRDRCIAAGMDDYIAKPIMPDVLNRVLADWLEHRATARSESSQDATLQARDVPVLDVDHLQAVQAYALTHDGERFNALLSAFVQELHHTLARLVTAHKGRSWSELQEGADHLRQIAGGFGAPRLHTLARDLLANARHRSRVLVDDLFPHLEASVQRTVNELERRYGPIALAGGTGKNRTPPMEIQPPKN